LYAKTETFIHQAFLKPLTDELYISLCLVLFYPYLGYGISIGHAAFIHAEFYGVKTLKKVRRVFLNLLVKGAE